MTIREEHFSSAHFIRYSGYPSPTLSFRAQREIFLALCSFLLLSQKVSPFPLSHIRHYPLLQERSLDFARDDDTGIALFKHIRCTLREINPFPHTVISSAARNLPCTPRFLASFAKGSPFPLSHIRRYTGVQERSRASLGMTLRKWRFPNISFIRDVGYPSPHTVISSKVEKYSSHSTFSCFLRRWIPVFRCLT